MNKTSISNKSFAYKDNGSVFDIYDIQYDVKLAANIIKTRIRLGMTQADLAKKIKAVQPAIARAENGNTPPSHKLLKKIARAFNARLIAPDFAVQGNGLLLAAYMTSVIHHSDDETQHAPYIMQPEKYAIKYTGSQIAHDAGEVPAFASCGV